MKRAQFLELVGEFPEKISLDVVVLEEEEKEKYNQRKIEYSVDRGERVRAYVLIPKDNIGKLPAIFAHHQHGTGKSEVVGLSGDPNLAYGKELAERGYVVIVPDAFAFEERNYLGDSGQTQYSEFTIRLVQGETLNAKVVHDISLALDYLCSLPVVDVDNIGFIGHSYGGQMALWYPVFDKRIKATVSNCRCITYADSIARGVGIQMEFAIPEIMKWGDIGDVVGLFDHCSSFISATTQDKYSFGAEKLYEYVKSKYPEQDISLKLYDGGHVFTPEMRKNAYAWLDSKLK